MYWEFGFATEYEDKTSEPTPEPKTFYVVEHEGGQNPITKTFDSIKEADTYFNEHIDYLPILYEVSPIQWVDKKGTKQERYN